MDPLISAGTLIIHVAFDAYIIILLLRLILQKLGANWFNPLSQFIIQLTEKPLKPLRKFVPGVKGFDLSILLLAIIVQLVEVILLWMLQFGPIPNIIGALVISFSELLSKVIYIYIYAIIISAVMSWIPSMQTHPLSHIIYLMVNPLLSRIRRFIPLIAGIDISPIFALLGFTLMNMLIVAPIAMLGTRIILG